MKRYLCPECGRPVGVNGRGSPGLASHFPAGDGSPNPLPRCAGTGTELAGLTTWTPGPEPKVMGPQPWTPVPTLPDLTPYRRWRALGWTERQIAAVTGPGALW